MDAKFIKITNSAYKVLEFLPEAEALKYKAKEKALSIMEGVVFIFGKEVEILCNTEYYIKVEQALIDIDIFLSYLKLAKERGWVDTINFLILEKEYKALEAEIVKLKGKCGEKNNQTPNPCPQLLSAIADGRRENTEQNPKPQTPKSIDLKLELTERQKKILEILQKNEKTQVSDIIKVLPDVTKRTIRRDMDELLKSGKVLRVGEFNQIFYKYAQEMIGHIGKIENGNGIINLS